MSGNLFEVSGVSLDNLVHILYGTGAPGTTQETNDAPIGSVYFDTSGITWKKLSAGSGSDKWGEDSVTSGITKFNSLTGTVIVDSLLASENATGVWAVTITRSANVADKQTVMISGSHNGAVARYNIFGKLSLGTKIENIDYSVVLAGDNLELRVSLPINCNIESYRLSGVSSSGVVTLGNGAGGSGGDVTSTQLNAEVAARQSGDEALDNKINSKADITGVVAQFNTVNTSITNLANVITSVSNNLASETSSRSTADTVIQTDITTLTTNLSLEVSARQAADTALQAALDAAVISGGGAPFEFSITVLGIPVMSATVGIYTFTRALTLTGQGVATAGTSPTGSPTFPILLNGSTIGNVTFSSTTGVVTLPSTTVAKGDRLTIKAPSTVDPTLSDISITLV